MPQELHLHLFPKEFGAGVNERGNVELFGIDKELGALVTLEIHSANWKHILAQLGRLKGVGIAKPKSVLEVVEEKAIEGNG